ncbi:ComEA family DNA-binding protein [Streptomyces sp. NPDC006798]|uniref:ComEA family DNA-binding protein n=1 Tax=Streptomyces sp. NPDC006798 TaxID=3155462 RepID=UPI0033F6B3E0
MASRSHTATSGPGRAPASDGRVRSRLRQRSTTEIGPRGGAHRGAGPGPGRGDPVRRAARRGAVRNASAWSTAARDGAAPVAGAAEPAAGTMPAEPPAVEPDGASAVDGTYSGSRGAVSFAGAREREGGAGAAGGEAGPDGGGRDPAGPGAGREAGSGAPVAPLRRAGLAVLERLPLWVRLRCGLEPRTLAALAVVLVAAVVLAGVHFWSGRPQTVRPPEPVRGDVPLREDPGRAASPPTPVPPGPGPVAGAPGETAPDGRVVVDVGGKVRRPGVLRLPAGSRVADALAAAGGPKEGTDLTGLNRARVLVDGEQVLVGVALPVNQATATGIGAAAPPVRTGPISLNTATAEELDTLPGVGPVLARHIVEYRGRGGGFRSVDELREVDGIGERRFADLRPLVRP